MPYLDAQGALPYQHGSDTSRDAALRAQAFIGQQGQDVLTWIASHGEAGATQKEASAALGIGRPSLCARFNALEQTGAIVKTTARRGGCYVYRKAA
jgi:hypothetical protein